MKRYRTPPAITSKRSGREVKRSSGSDGMVDIAEIMQIFVTELAANSILNLALTMCNAHDVAIVFDTRETIITAGYTIIFG